MSRMSSLYFPPFRLELGNERLWRENTQVVLRRKTFAVLQHLVERHGQLVTKAQVLEAVWPDTYVGEVALTICITELRKALGDAPKAPRFIETVRGRGYRFLPAVTTQPVRSREQLGVQSCPRFGLRTPNSKLRDSLLVGREAELLQLHNWWEKALNGERQLVFVTGEPGIGKTTLVEAFLFGVRGHEKFGVAKVPPQTPNSELPSTPQWWVGEGRCIEHYGVGEAYLPILEALGRLCRELEGKDIIALLQQHAPSWLVQMPTVLSPTELEELQRRTAGVTRERMLRELAEALEVITVEYPLVLVLEDLHWSDVSTLALLAFIARRKERARVLVIGTYRPVEMLSDGHPLKEVVQELYAHGLATELALGALRETDIEAYLATRFGAEERCPSFLTTLTHLLYFRTDGNPLFFVSVVNDLIAHGALVQTDSGWELRDDTVGQGTALPDSIRHLVARQYGRLTTEKRNTLEAASVAGLEFSAASVAAALAVDTTTVERQCEQLAEHQQFVARRGVETWPDGTLAARYRFLHALYQHFWHERVSPTQLQHYHLAIGERKERAYGEHAREIATELALHFEQGRNFGKAVQYLHYAGTNALQRSAHQEAVSLLTQGVELLKTLPTTTEHARQELRLQLALGPALIATRGNAAPEVEQSYRRAQVLCQQVGETQQLFPALFGLRSFYVVHAEVQTAHAFGQQLLHLAERKQEADFLLEAHVALGATSIQLGELTEALTSMEQALASYDPGRCHSHIALYGIDPGVLCCSCLSWVLQWLGYPDQALKKDHEALELAQKLSHPFSQAVALNNSVVFYGHRHELQVMQRQAEALLALATAQGFPAFVAVGTILQGVALAEQGQREAGIAQAHRGLAALRAARAELPRPFFLILLAETCGRIGEIEEGLKVLDEVLAIVGKTGARIHEAELYRLKGELTLQSMQVEDKSKPSHRRVKIKSEVPSTQHQTPSTHAEAEAEACFLKAIDIARQQQAKSLELRATVSLVRLRQQQAEQAVTRTAQQESRAQLAEAHRMLSETYHWFTEGFDTKDLQEAKALIEELKNCKNG